MIWLYYLVTPCMLGEPRMSASRPKIVTEAIAPKVDPAPVLASFHAIFPYIRPYWHELILLLIIVPLAGAVVVVITPVCTKLIIDVAFPQKDVSLLVVLALVGTAAHPSDRHFVP